MRKITWLALGSAMLLAGCGESEVCREAYDRTRACVARLDCARSPSAAVCQTLKTYFTVEYPAHVDRLKQRWSGWACDNRIAEVAEISVGCPLDETTCLCK